MALKSKGRKPRDSLKDVNELPKLIEEVSAMLELSLQQRDLATSQLFNAQQRFEEADYEYRTELAELPPDLDAYLRIVRDKKRMEQKQRELEAQSQVSHALNFHLGGGPMITSGTSLMDELRAEEAELDRQAKKFEEEEAERKRQEEDEENNSKSSKKKRKKKNNAGTDGQVDNSSKAKAKRAQDQQEEEAHMKFNQRDGLFSHLDAAWDKEAELEQNVMNAPEGSRQRLEAETELTRFRHKHNKEVAAFFNDYNPQRVQRGKEESLSALGLFLPEPSDIVTSTEEETLNSPNSASMGSGGGFQEDVDPDEEYVRRNEEKLLSGALSPLKHVPQSLQHGSNKNLDGSNKSIRQIPGIGMSQKMSDTVVRDPLHGRSILDLPTDNVNGGFGERPISSSGSHRLNSANGNSRKNNNISPLSSNREGVPSETLKTTPNKRKDVKEDIKDIRGTVLQNTAPIDLSFPTLEFIRKKGDEKNAYFEPGVPPPVYKVSQSDGAVWSAMARERREIYAKEEQEYQEMVSNSTKSNSKSSNKTSTGSFKKKTSTKKKFQVESNNDDSSFSKEEVEGELKKEKEKRKTTGKKKKKRGSKSSSVSSSILLEEKTAGDNEGNASSENQGDNQGDNPNTKRF